MDSTENNYPDDFASTILLLEQLTSILHRDCARVAEGTLESEKFFETVSAAHEAVMRAKELQDGFDRDIEATGLHI